MHEENSLGSSPQLLAVFLMPHGDCCCCCYCCCGMTAVATMAAGDTRLLCVTCLIISTFLLLF
jgi:hypothetical protein